MSEKAGGAARLVGGDVPGIVGQTRTFFSVLEGLSLAAERLYGVQHEFIRFPPVMSRRTLNKIGYFKNFPQLLGSIHCFCGDENAHHKLAASDSAQWTSADEATDLVLTPAACYPVYPALAARGSVPLDGYSVQVRSHCFRREPSDELTRLQSFQMQELVRVGSNTQATEFQAHWLEQGPQFFEALQLPATIVDANDPFFGRASGVLRKGQRAQNLKYELVVPINDGAPPTACMSFNYHVDFFGQALSLRGVDGETAHTACTGIGLERTVFALFRWHGDDVGQWPEPVRNILRMS
jgi:seryl-tRNA synthetase